MDPSSVASTTTLLTPIFGAHVAGILSLVALASVAVAHGVMPYLPVATGASRGGYRALYGLLRLAAGNYRNAAPAAASPSPPIGAGS